MASRIYPIWHNGKKIYFTDWSNLTNIDESINAIEETVSFLEKNNEYNLLEIIDVRGSYASTQVLKKLKNGAKRSKPYGRKKAMVGIKGSKRVLLMAVNRFIDSSIKGFENIEEAKEWLTSEG